MSPAIRFNPSAGRSGGAMSSCRAVSGIPLQDLSMPPGGAVGQLACLGSPSIQTGGARVLRANAQTLGSGFANRWFDLDSDLRVRMAEAALGTQPAAREKPARQESQRKDHPMQQPRPIMQQHRTRQTLPAPSAIRAYHPPITHAPATSCLVCTCVHRRWR
jgi:hypothetical protein